jgi:hypothetical protein
MKIKEMNTHQLAMYRLMDYWTNEMIGGCENALQDYEENSEDYKEAEDFLNQTHEQLADYFYNMVMQDCKKGTNAEHARFAGADFLKERIDRRLTKWGY